ncbi:hypothetical protein LIPSTDRAFT_224963 [Lipomyces starkeyi NRRL Y-11557]|uniref:Uncharacterized protein n=1 Tax=Lipomyces starkeyi NRRL Y-11557 TaxID=675824 RepID=A0A1E3PU10_LIPST|nr:hypothetical protein LIPSTDRAFT_224963 [Lipomyces starkeyi NRRL Y-11557]
MDFWAPFQEAAGVHDVGEVFDGDLSYGCPYQENLNGVLNYPMYYPVIRVSQYDYAQVLKPRHYSPRVLPRNQDIPRLPSYTSDESLITNAIASLYSQMAFIIYYGQEQELSGGNDPYNREELCCTCYSTTSTL